MISDNKQPSHKCLFKQIKRLKSVIKRTTRYIFNRKNHLGCFNKKSKKEQRKKHYSTRLQYV